MDATSPSTFPLARAEAPAAGHTRHPPSRFKRQLTQAPSGWFLVQALARSGLQPKDHSPAHRPEDAKYSDTCGGQAP